jgi:hypothetical protein
MKRLAAGLHILMKYDPDGSTCAEHDCIYAYPNIKKDTLSEEDAKEMDRLGWFWDFENGCWAYFT